MNESPQKAQIGELLRQFYKTVPRRRFWLVVARGIGIGILLGAPVVALLLYHEGAWTGFIWDLLFRLPFLLLVIAFLAQTVRSVRSGKFKEAMKGFPVLIFFGLITSLAWYEFVQHMQAAIHFHRLETAQVREVRVGCHTTEDSLTVQQISNDLRGAEWYSPDSHGWSTYADLMLRFADGHTENYSLTHILAEGRLVVRWPGNNGVLVAVPNLAKTMQEAGLLKVAAYPRYDNKGYYLAIVPPSVCKQEMIRDN